MFRRKKENKLKEPVEACSDILQTRARLLALYSSAVSSKDKSQMDRLNEKIWAVNNMFASLSRIEADVMISKPEKRTFLFSSFFLFECFKELTLDSREQFFFVTGSESEGLLIADQKFGFEHVSRTPSGVEGDIKSTHGRLCLLEQFGHRLLAHFHSHPGQGLGSTQPSPTDRAFQQRLERGGYPAIAAIFSRDGFIRFFRIDQSFTLQIYGKGVEEVETNIYRLTDFN